MKTRRWLTAVVAAVPVAAACGHDFEPPDRTARVEQAEAAYDAAVFDSISWAGDDVRLDAGNTVYVEKCRRCHGALGRGETDYARERGLTVPSLVAPDWPLAQMDSIRHAIFVGHESMPVFGDDGLSPREIDAVGAYVVLTLRPEVLNGGGS